MIPKIIHQIWLQGHDSLPVKYHGSESKWRNVSPAADYFFWDEVSLERLVSNQYPEFLKVWTRLKPYIKKCDLARYLLLHHFGGIYADFDTTPHNDPFKLAPNLEIEGFDAIFCKESYEEISWKTEASKSPEFSERPDKIVGNAVLLSRKSAKIWIDFIEVAIPRKDLSVLESFSTWHLSRFLERRTDNDFIILEYKHLLSAKYYSGLSYVTHDYDGSWFDRDSNVAWRI
ncbi:glycosyltransferase family 32 protein [Roseovarius tibetensis]|uniref:glycosyltransferase family 32 protein n=1 Tax=Roseovarius tibetensis TaxID=2685897 RepID=UPI003D7FDACA